MRAALYKGQLDVLDNLGMSARELDGSIRLIRYLAQNQSFEEFYSRGMLDVPKDTRANFLGYKQAKIIRSLQNRGVIDVNHSYWHSNGNGEGQCKSMSLNFDLMSDSIDFYNKRSELKGRHISGKLENYVKDVTAEIQILHAQEYLDQYVDNLLTDKKIREGIQLNGEIIRPTVNLGSKKKPRWISTDLALSQAEQKGQSLISTKKRTVMADLGTYMERKRSLNKMHYRNQIIRIQEGDIYSGRNDENYRLDSNLTGTKKELLSLMKLGGEPLAEIDLSNSQFRIFSFCLELILGMNESSTGRLENHPLFKPTTVYKHKRDIQKCLILLQRICNSHGLLNSVPDDLIEFIECTKRGLFYEGIANLIQIKTDRIYKRKVIKNLMFQIIFSGINFRSPFKTIFQKAFPTVSKIIYQFKKQSKILIAVFLQEVESLIFIDKIYKAMCVKNLMVIPKHDSFLFKQSDLDKVKSLTEQYLNVVLGERQYSLKTSTF